MRRRLLGTLALGALLTAPACAGSVGLTEPASSVAPAAEPSTTAAIPTTAAAPIPTTRPAAATTAPTTVGAPSGAPIGPPPNLVTLVESPLATRNLPAPAGSERYRDGVMVEASNPAYDRAFVLTMFAADLAGARPAPGWTLRTIDEDRQWTPAAWADAARVFVGRRWEVYLDVAIAVDPTGAPQPGTAAPQLQLVSFDVVTGRMASHLETPNQVRWFGSLFAYDDHTVGILFDPSSLGESQPDPAVAAIRDRLAVRRIDLATGRAVDAPVPLPNGYTYRDATFDGNGAVIVFTTSDERLRGAPGKPMTLIDPDEPSADQGVDPGVDGVRLDWSAVQGDPLPDVPVRGEGDKVLATVHPWRFRADGGSLGLFGWASNRGWFGAFRDDPSTGAAAAASPGVYDVATAAWDWVFDAASPGYTDAYGLSFFVVGTVPKAPAPA